MPIDSNLSPTVFVVDDDDQLRAALEAILSAQGFVVRTFPTAGSFIRYYQRKMPGCLIADIRLRRQTGIELYEQLVQEGKRLPVIFITAHADVPTAVAAMKTGAVEFLEKPLDQKQLLESVRAALALDAQWRTREAEFAAVEERIGRLSERERETLALVMAGEPNKSVAAKLFLTERAVEMRRASIMKKLEVESLAELLELAVTHRILNELRHTAPLIDATSAASRVVLDPGRGGGGHPANG
jgi:FixJ family two-component response regulator